MRQEKVIRYVTYIGLIAALLIGVTVLNVSVHQLREDREKTALQTDQQESKLNVAIVNEDQAVVVDQKEYNLGASYIKNIERDDSQNWSVVTRGTAEAGLERGDYQLVLTIPTNFSQKIMDVNSVSADKALVTYKVNAAGNMQVENEANKLAKDVVADLNRQLVDMYMASILSNLYTAQQNVQASSEVQQANVGFYQSNLLESAIQSRNIFPTLYTMSSASVDANLALRDSLQGYYQAFDNLDTSQASYKTDFETLIEQRGSDRVNYADFMSQLMEMNQAYLGEQTAQLYAQLQVRQEKLGNQIGDPSQTEGAENDTVIKQVENVESALKEERSKLDSHKEAIKSFVEGKLTEYYGEGKVSLDRVFKQSSLESLDQSESVLKNQLTNAIAELPVENFSGKQFTDFGMAITIPTLDYDSLKDYGNPSGQTSTSELAELAQKGTVAAQAKGQAGTKAKVSWQAPAGVSVQSVAYNGAAVVDGQEITLEENGRFEIHYSMDKGEGASSEGEASSESAPTASSIAISLNGVQAVTAPVDTQSLTVAAASYAAKVQKVEADYKRVQELLDAYRAVEALKNEDMTTALTELLTTAIQSNIESYQSSLTQGDATQGTIGAQGNLDQSIEQLKAKIETVRTSNRELSETIQEQMNLYDRFKERLTNLSEAQASNSAALEKTDAELSALNSEYSSLLTATSGVKESSQSNVEAAESANQMFSQFNEELANAQTSTEKLSSDAEQLMSRFNEELAANGDFVSSFVTVLHNAYENGVPNEVLLDFLSSPVAQSSSSVRSSVNVYRPFTWILLLEIVSLFSAYLFATQEVVRRVKDKFRLDRLQDTDITAVGVLAVLAIGSGLIIGMISSSQLQVGSEFVPSWVVLVAISSLILMQGQYLLLKHARVIGMGLAFFMMISFVYLSSAVGTTASLTGFPAFMKTINPLSILENLLSAYFDGRAAGFFVFFGFLIVLGLLVAANIFVKPRMRSEVPTEA